MADGGGRTLHDETSRCGGVRRGGIGRWANRARASLAAAALVPLMLLCLPAAPLAGQEENQLGDPLPLKRIIVPPERITAELQRVQDGVLARMPAAEFEALVKQAARAQKDQQAKPGLIRAQYSAEFSGQSLRGTGAWTVVQPGEGPGILPLKNLNVALASVKSQSGKNAILGKVAAAKGQREVLSLVLDKPGKQSFYFDWSKRGVSTSSGLQFDLKLPPCVLSVLELKVPDDHVVFVGTSANPGAGGSGPGSSPVGLLTGPFQAEEPNKRLWQLNLPARGPVSLGIRPLAVATDLDAVQLAKLVTHQEVTPERVDAEFAFDIDVQQLPVRSLSFDVDPSLTPYDITLQNAEIQGWQIIEPKTQTPPKTSPKTSGKNLKKGNGTKEAGKVRAGKRAVAPNPARLVVQLREPFQGTLQGLKIRALGPRPENTLWHCPYVRLRQALMLSETIKLTLHPDVQMERWDPGNFELRSSTVNENNTKQTLTLIEPRAGTQPSARPSALLRARGVELRSELDMLWKIGPKGTTLDCTVDFDVARGDLFQIVLKLPQDFRNWQVDSVKLSPTELLADWVTVGPLLIIDLRQSLNGRRTAQLSLRLQSPWKSLQTESTRIVPFPSIETVAASAQQGKLDIAVDGSLVPGILQSSQPPAPPPDVGQLADSQAAIYSFPFRGRSVSGRLRLQTGPADLFARAQSVIELSDKRNFVQTRLELDPLSGSLPHLDLLVSGRLGGSLSARFENSTSYVRRIQRLPVLPAAPVPSMVTAFAQALPEVAGLSLYRIHFFPPLTSPETLVVELPCKLTEVADQTRQEQDGSNAEGAVRNELRRNEPVRKSALWDIPLISLLAPHHLDAGVRLRQTGSQVRRVLRAGLGEGRTGSTTDPGPSFVYGRSPTAPRLLVETSTRVDVKNTQVEVDQARLLSYVLPQGQLFHHFSWRLGRVGSSHYHIVIPQKKARVLAARIEGRWLEAFNIEPLEDGIKVVFPISELATGQQVEIFYSEVIDWSSWPVWATLQAPWPLLPSRQEPLTRERLWRLAPGLSPLGQGRWQDLSALPGRQSALIAPAENVWQIGKPHFDSWFVPRKKSLEALPVLIAAESVLRKKLFLEDDAVEPTGQNTGAASDGQVTFGTALRRLAFEHLKDQALLVIDVAGLRDANVSVDTPLRRLQKRPRANNEDTPPGSRPFWEQLDLIAVPLPGAVLLTTRSQLALRPQLQENGNSELDVLVDQLIRHGRDYTGQFQTVPMYLRQRLEPPILPDHALGDDVPRGLFFGELPPGWTEWQALPGLRSAGRLVVLRKLDIRNIAYGLGLATLIITWFCRRQFAVARGFRAFLLWTLGWGLMFLWLPMPVNQIALGPLLMGLMLGLLSYFFWLVAKPRRDEKQGRSTMSMRPGMGSNLSTLLLLLAPGLLTLELVTGVLAGGTPDGGTPDGGTPNGTPNGGVSTDSPNAANGKDKSWSVFLLPRGQNGASASSVLASPALIERLQKMRSHPLLSDTRTLLVSGSYQGRASSGQGILRMHATFDVYNFANQGILTLPLQGVELQEGAFLDGAPVYPVASDTGAGYVLTVPGAGWHRLSLRFTCRTALANDSQEARFQIPKLPQSQLQLIVPETWQELQLTQCLGSIDVVKAGKNKEIKAELGMQDAVQLRWRAEEISASTASVEVQEAYLWDLQPADYTVIGLLDYQVLKGSVSEFRLAIPDSLEVRSVELGTDGAPARILRWRLTGKNPMNNPGKTDTRLLRVELASPVTGKVQLILGLVPRLALDTGKIQLRLPQPLNARPREGVLAYRIEGWDTIDKPPQGLATTRIAPEQVTKTWQTLRENSAGTPSRAYSFRRTPGSAMLPLELVELKSTGRQEVVCSVESAFADVRIKWHVQNPRRDFSFLQCELPRAMTLVDVTGQNLHHWSQDGDLVQIWLSHPAKDAAVELHGWQTHDKQPKGKSPGRFVLPNSRLTHVTTKASSIDIRLARDCMLEPIRLTELIGVPQDGEEAKSGIKHMRFQARNPDKLAGVFKLNMVPAPPVVRTLTIAELLGNNLATTFHLHLQQPAGNLQQLTVRFQNYNLDGLELDSSVPVLKNERTRVGPDLVWKLSLAARQLQPVALTFRGRATLTGIGPALLPRIEVDGVQDRDRFLALLGPDLRLSRPASQTAPPSSPQAISRMTALTEALNELHLWPGERSRVQRQGQAWRIGAGGAGGAAEPLEILPRPSTPTAAVHVLSAEHQLYLHDEGYWVHQAEFFAVNRTLSQLRVALPEDAQLLGVSWGNDLLNPARLANHRLGLILTAQPQGQTLRLRWRFADGLENKDAPALAFPGLIGLEVPDHQVRILLPPKVRPQHSQQTTLPAVVYLIQQARAQMELARLLAENTRDDKGAIPDVAIVDAEKRFYQFLQNAEYELAWNRVSATLPEQKLNGLTEEIKNLRATNRVFAGKGGYEPQRSRAKSQAGQLVQNLDRCALPQALSLPARGLPSYWTPPAGERPSALLLSFPLHNDLGPRLIATQILLVVVVALFIATTLPRFFRWLPALWPEQVILVGLAGSLAFGLTPLALLLILAGITGRITMTALQTMRFLNRFFKRRPPAKQSSAIHPPSNA